MIDLSKFDKNLVNLYNIIFNLNFNDLVVSIYDDSLYKKTPFEYETNSKLDYSKLNLNENQRKVIENYLNFLEHNEEAKIRLAYLKAIEHTIKFIKDTEFLRDKTTPKN